MKETCHMTEATKSELETFASLGFLKIFNYYSAVEQAIDFLTLASPRLELNAAENRGKLQLQMEFESLAN